MTCQCKWLRYTPRSQDGQEQQMWTCPFCDERYDVIAIREMMLKGADVNELSMVAIEGD